MNVLSCPKPLRTLPKRLSPVMWALVTAATSLFSLSCERRPAPGFLHVESQGPGTFEIYRIANESPLQFVSEESGRFNEDLPLAAGSYLVLADCSSETVVIYPGQHAKLMAHRVEFLPPGSKGAPDAFAIQCSRADQTKSRQLIAGRMSLSILHGKRDLLAGMVPLHIDFTSMDQPTKPKTLTYKLAAIQVADYPGNRQDTAFFVSPVDEMIAATKYQMFGHWEYVLPGRYTVAVNGTKMQVELTEGQERIIKPGLFSVTTSPSVDLSQPARIKGSPWLVEINSGHWLSFNETYPVLPGDATIAVSGTTQAVDVKFFEGESLELKARSVVVESGCSRAAAGDAGSCGGDRGVSIYRPNEPYPFVESVSDIPILFIDDGQPVLVGVDGSRDIVAEIPTTARDRVLVLGYAHLIPSPAHRPGQVTDLVRVAGAGPSLTGHSLDVNLERPTLMPLVVGSYRLDQFISISQSSTDGARQAQTRGFAIEGGQTVDLEFPTYLPEKKYLAWRRRHPGGTAEEGTGPRPESANHVRLVRNARIL